MKSLLLLLLFTLSLNLFAQPLRVQGKYIYNNKGEEVILRGIGLGGWMLQEPYMLKLSGRRLLTLLVSRIQKSFTKHG